jgi:membrane protein
MKAIDNTIEKADEFQERHRFLGFPFAVIKKFGDDQAGNLAALIAYYGFFSLFPLLLVLVAVLNLVLKGNPDLRGDILNSALRQFPIIGSDLGRLSAFKEGGAGVAIGIGTLTALWAGLGVTQAAQNAMNTVWDVPRKERPNFVKSRLRGLLLLVVLGSFVLASTFLSGLGTSTGSLGALLRVAGFVASLVLNLALFMLAYKVLTDRDVSWRDVFPGAAFGAVVWTILQVVGGLYVSHTLKGSTNLYGTFAVVLGLLAWLYLGAQVFVYGAEINVVKAQRLWPRNIKTPPVSEADARVAARKAKAEERYPQEDVRVRLDEQVVEPEDRRDVASTPGIEVEPDEGAGPAPERSSSSSAPERSISSSAPGPSGPAGTSAPAGTSGREEVRREAPEGPPPPASPSRRSTAGPGRRTGLSAVALGALGGILLSWRRGRRDTRSA